MKKFLILIFLLNFSILFPRGNFERLSMQEGISLNLVYTMIEDSRGFIWFGTMYGLVKYDGERFTVYRHDPDNPASISFDDVTALLEDRRGNIWIGTWGGGLNKLNPFTEKFERFVYDPAKPKGISENIVWSIAEDKSGSIWISTENSGLNKYDPLTKTFKVYNAENYAKKGLKTNSLGKIFTINDGSLLIGTMNGLLKYNPTDDSFSPFFSDSLNRKSFLNLPISSILEDENYFWIGTPKGLAVIK